jgi:hypothetical protein
MDKNKHSGTIFYSYGGRYFRRDSNGRTTEYTIPDQFFNAAAKHYDRIDANTGAVKNRDIYRVLADLDEYVNADGAPDTGTDGNPFIAYVNALAAVIDANENGN